METKYCFRRGRAAFLQNKHMGYHLTQGHISIRRRASYNKMGKGLGCNALRDQWEMPNYPTVKSVCPKHGFAAGRGGAGWDLKNTDLRGVGGGYGGGLSGVWREKGARRLVLTRAS